MNSFLCQFDEWPWRPAERRAETNISQWRSLEGGRRGKFLSLKGKKEGKERVGGREGALCVVFRAGRQTGRAAEGAVIMARAAAKAHYPRQKTSYGFSSPTYSVPQNPSGPAQREKVENEHARSSQSAKRCDVPLILIYFSSRLSRKRESLVHVCRAWTRAGCGGRGRDGPADRRTHLPRRRPSRHRPCIRSLAAAILLLTRARAPAPEVAAIMENAFGDNYRVGLVRYPL